MRFENWDILLFPQMSGTPIQEFRTECFGVANRLRPELHFLDHQADESNSNRRNSNTQCLHSFTASWHSLQDLLTLVVQASLAVAQ